MNEKPSTARIALKWGIISSIIGILITLLVNNTVLSKYLMSLGTVSMIIYVGVLFFAIREYKTLNGGYLAIGEGIGVGTLLVGISVLISTTFEYIYSNFIDLSYNERRLRLIEETYIQQGFSEEQISTMLETSSKYMNSGLAIFLGVLFSIFFAAIASLIISAIMRKNRPVFA